MSGVFFTGAGDCIEGTTADDTGGAEETANAHHTLL